MLQLNECPSREDSTSTGKRWHNGGGHAHRVAV